MAQELLDFTYVGIKGGNKIKGEISARDELVAKSMLRKQEIKIVSIKVKKQTKLAKGKAIKPSDIAIMARQLATMMQAGVPLVQSFEILAKGTSNPTMQNLLLAIKKDVEEGSTLTEALEKHPFYFDELFCNLVRSGETAGVLETILDKIATYKEKTESLKKKIKKALTYPIGVLVVAAIVTSILLIFVVPVFEDMFKSFGADLPAPTKMVVEMSNALRSTWYIFVAIIGGGVWGLKQGLRRSKNFARAVDRQLLKVPAIGEILRKSAIARFSRTLATLSTAGVPLVDALYSVSGATGNVVYQEAVLKMREEVSLGTQLKQSMLMVNVFPHLVIQMTSIGEESGKLDSMLGKVADFFEEDVNNAVDNLTAMLEPMIMAILGVIIGGLIIAMYLPIFKMGAAVG